MERDTNNLEVAGLQKKIVVVKDGLHRLGIGYVTVTDPEALMERKKSLGGIDVKPRIELKALSIFNTQTDD